MVSRTLPQATKDLLAENACISIMGERLTRAIINDMGLHWAVAAATADERAADHPKAMATIRKWLEEQST